MGFVFSFITYVLSCNVIFKEVKIKERLMANIEFDEYLIFYENKSMFDLQKHDFLSRHYNIKFIDIVNDSCLLKKHSSLDLIFDRHKRCDEVNINDEYVFRDKEEFEEINLKQAKEVNCFLSYDKNNLSKDSEKMLSNNSQTFGFEDEIIFYKKSEKNDDINTDQVGGLQEKQNNLLWKVQNIKLNNDLLFEGIDFFNNSVYEKHFKFLEDDFKKNNDIESNEIIKSELKKSIGSGRKTFIRFYRFSNNFLKIFHHKLDLTVNYIEKNFLIRLNEIIKPTTGLRQTNLNKIFDCDETNQKLKLFYDTYLRNKRISKYFQNNNVNSVEINKKNFDNRLKSLLNEFNDLCVDYFIDVSSLFEAYDSYYFNVLAKLFMSKKDEEKINISRIIVDYIFNNEKFIVLLILFPELKYFIETSFSLFFVNATFFRIHLMISIIVLKFVVTLPFLYEEYLNYHENVYKITDSKIFNQFILETKCLIFFYSLYILKFQNDFSAIFMRTFISFLRLKEGNIQNCFIFNEFTDFNKTHPTTRLFKIYNSAKIEIIRFHKFEKNTLNYFRTLEINNSSVNYELKDENESEKLKTLYLNINDHKTNLEEFISRNEKLSEKICEMFNEIFKK